MIRRWQHLCIFGRIASVYNDLDGMLIEHDGKNIIVSNVGDMLHYIDTETGEVLVTQGTDGLPTYVDDWAQGCSTELPPLA